ncbi:hypothetical protein niasHS_017107 [Heterodera schachtii]|uniref:Nuclear receptor domain-containing protein n=1 Tax=Heterodera schachtii TaxID=97005 RepID=A0ABD2I7N3_HETSC
MKEYKCTNGGKCEIEKNYAVCKRCRLNKCLTVGMNPRGVCITKIDEERMLAFVQRIKQQPPKDADLNYSAPGQKQLLDLIMVKHLMEAEQKMCRIRNSRTPITESFYDQCNSFESIFARKFNFLDCSYKDSIDPPNAPPAANFEKINHLGPGLAVITDHGSRITGLIITDKMNYGPTPGALRYVELMGMVECLFNTGANHRKLFTYHTILPNCFPQCWPKIAPKGPSNRTNCYRFWPHFFSVPAQFYSEHMQNKQPQHGIFGQTPHPFNSMNTFCTTSLIFNNPPLAMPSNAYTMPRTAHLFISLHFALSLFLPSNYWANSLANPKRSLDKGTNMNTS